MLASEKAEIDWYSESSNDYFHEYYSCSSAEGHVSAIDIGAGLMPASGPLNCALAAMQEVPLHLQVNGVTPDQESLSKHVVIPSICARATLTDYLLLHQNVKIKLANVSKEYHHFVDLSDDLDCIKRRFRKSYKSLVNKQDGIVAHDGNGPTNLMDDCREVHLRLAGRATRSEKSWALMGDALRREQAELITSEYDGEILGYCYISHNGINAYYSSSAILERKGMHPLIWKAIEQCKKKGLKRLYMDIEAAEGDRTSKEQSIAYFKRGFGLKVQEAMRFVVKRPRVDMKLFYQ